MALIIEAGGSPFCNSYLQGTQKDLSAWEHFLMSLRGGAWNNGEIQTLSNPSKNGVQLAIQAMRGVDYSLVCFSGHGGMKRKNNEWGLTETIISLNQWEDISERELNTGTKWCMLILDCCRTPLEKEASVLLPENFSLFDKECFRIKFDLYLSDCETGFVKVYSAGEGQAASDDISFTRFLIGTAANDSLYNIDGVLTIDRAVGFAREILAPKQQSPEYQGGRRRHHFPFAVL